MGYLYFKRYFLSILKIHFGVLLDTEPVSGPGLPIHNLWFGLSLVCRILSLAELTYKFLVEFDA